MEVNQNVEPQPVADSNTSKTKNRITIVALFAMFIVPVTIAYAAYFAGWFDGASKNRGELLTEAEILDIEDYEFLRENGEKITGKEFETIYWWVMPINPVGCDQACLELNLFMLNQTYVGLGKEQKRINPLLVLPKQTVAEIGEFPVAFSDYDNRGVKSRENTHTGKSESLPANYIYLVDPLGNVFMRYPLVEGEEQAPKISKDLREDIKRLFKYSRLG